MKTALISTTYTVINILFRIEQPCSCHKSVIFFFICAKC